MPKGVLMYNSMCIKEKPLPIYKIGCKTQVVVISVFYHKMRLFYLTLLVQV